MRKGKEPEPDPYLWLLDPDPDPNPGGPKTCGSWSGSGSPTLAGRMDAEGGSCLLYTDADPWSRSPPPPPQDQGFTIWIQIRSSLLWCRSDPPPDPELIIWIRIQLLKTDVTQFLLFLPKQKYCWTRIRMDPHLFGFPGCESMKLDINKQLSFRILIPSFLKMFLLGKSVL